jgi:mycofactocin system transcriptional regulator
METSSTSTSSVTTSSGFTGFMGLLQVGFWHCVPNFWHTIGTQCRNSRVKLVRMDETPRRGRPPGTSGRELEEAALRLFTELGYHETTVEDIAAAAGVSRRTFFRYFDSKAAVLWGDFDAEVTELRAAFAEIAPDAPLMAAIRQVVVGVNHYRAADVPELRLRMHLIATHPELAAEALRHYDAWEREVAAFAAARLGVAADELYPLAIARTTLAAARAAFDRWATLGDADLPVYLDAALAALGAGFANVGCSA